MEKNRKRERKLKTLEDVNHVRAHERGELCLRGRMRHLYAIYIAISMCWRALSATIPFTFLYSSSGKLEILFALLPN